MKVSVRRSCEVTLVLTEEQAHWLAALVGGVGGVHTAHGRFLSELYVGLQCALKDSPARPIPRASTLYEVDASRRLVAIAPPSPRPPEEG